MNIRPLSDRVVIKPRSSDDDQVTAGGIVLPDAAKKVQQRGVVTVIGPRVTGLRVGDDVYFSIYAGTRVTVSGEEVIIMSEGDVLAVFPVVAACKPEFRFRVSQGEPLTAQSTLREAMRSVAYDWFGVDPALAAQSFNLPAGTFEEAFTSLRALGKAGDQLWFTNVSTAERTYNVTRLRSENEQ